MWRVEGIEQANFGTLPDGRPVPAVTLTNAQGVVATVIAWGATLQALIVPDRRGGRADVVLGHATLDEYLDRRQYFGGTVGRFANRIARGAFTLDGASFRLPVNDGVNALHGGLDGFDRRLWTIADYPRHRAVTLRYVSRDGEEGYPGTLTVDATYALDDDDVLTIEYVATTDAPTIVNLTNHTYWNLSGEGGAADAMGHVVTLLADHFLPTDAGSIPTGEIRPVVGTVFDFDSPRLVGERVTDMRDAQIAIGRGYDHCWIADGGTGIRAMAWVYDPASGRSFELRSNQPGLQFYSGNFLDGTTRGKTGRFYRTRDGVAFEPQRLPDTPNRPAFGSARLAPSEIYRNVIEYRLAW